MHRCKRILPLAVSFFLGCSLMLQAQIRINPVASDIPPPPTGPAGINSLPGDTLTTSVTGARAVLSAGDLLDIGVFDTPELTQRVRIDGEGQITLPLIGTLNVKGSSPTVVRNMIRERLIVGHFVKDPQIAIFVAEYAGQMVYVSGEVNRPGAYSLLRNYHLMDLLSVAGGLTSRAGNAVTITRSADPKHPLILDLGDREIESNNPDISPGDSVSVGPAGVIYVLGAVGRGGGFLLDRRIPLTVMQALSLAEGPSQVASLRKASLIHSADPNPEPIPIDLKMILQSKEPDVRLRAGDILWVSDSQTRNLGRLAISTILATAGGVAVYAAYPR